MAEDENTSSEPIEGTVETQVPNNSEELKQIAESLKQMNQQFTEQKQFNQVVADQLQQAQTTTVAPVAQTEPASDSFFDTSPQAFKQELLQEVGQIVTQTQQKSVAVQEVMASIVKDYPEAEKKGSDMFNKILEIHGGLPKSLQGTPEGYELAASKAARSLGLQPMAMRSSSDADNFSLSGNRASGETGKSTKKKELDPKTEALADLMGLDMDNKDTRKRVEGYAKRDNWKRYR